MPDSVGHRTDHVDPWNEGLSPRAASPLCLKTALRSVPGVMYWAAWQEQVGPHALRHAISAYVDAHNDEGKPFKWTKTADEILAKVKRFGQRTVQVHGGPR